jgi:hypothetical protein
MAMKKVPAKNKGLKKLPKAVRNKMGFMKNGGKVKKKKGYKAGGKVKKGYKLGGAIKAIKAKPKKMMGGGAMRKKGYKAGGKVTPKKMMGGGAMRKKMMRKGGAAKSRR